MYFGKQDNSEVMSNDTSLHALMLQWLKWKLCALVRVNNEVPVLPSMKRGLGWSVSRTARPLVQQICLTSRRNRQVRGITLQDVFIFIYKLYVHLLNNQYCLRATLLIWVRFNNTIPCGSTEINLHCCGEEIKREREVESQWCQSREHN